MTRFYIHWVLDLYHVENILIFLNIFFKFLNILKYFKKYLSIHWDLDLGQFKNSALQLRQPDQSAQQVILEIPHLCFFNQCYNEWCFWPISKNKRERGGKLPNDSTGTASTIFGYI